VQRAGQVAITGTVRSEVDNLHLLVTLFGSKAKDLCVYAVAVNCDC
jgi:hypothetical protein